MSHVLNYLKFHSENFSRLSLGLRVKFLIHVSGELNGASTSNTRVTIPVTRSNRRPPACALRTQTCPPLAQITPEALPPQRSPLGSTKTLVSVGQSTEATICLIQPRNTGASPAPKSLVWGQGVSLKQFSSKCRCSWNVPEYGSTSGSSHLSLGDNCPQHQGLFQRVGSSHQVVKVLELQHQSFQ